MPEDPFDDLPYDDIPNPDYGLSARQALLKLLSNEDKLSDEQFEFVSSCAKFIRLSPKQQQALLDTWFSVEAAIALRRAQLHRKKRSRDNAAGGPKR